MYSAQRDQNLHIGTYADKLHVSRDDIGEGRGYKLGEPNVVRCMCFVVLDVDLWYLDLVEVRGDEMGSFIISLLAIVSLND